MKESYGICDDYGVWVVSAGHDGGPYETMDDAQAECNRRNHEAGIANEDGELKATLSAVDVELWRSKHASLPDCTCSKGGQING
jgi:hypothetical protein